jgi:cytoplasmic iron level regulating protein YaaA (DUF328/UPF0246 family)
MLTVISPAKSLDWAPVEIVGTQPAFQDDAIRLAKTSRNLTLGALKTLMSISDDLARLNHDRFKAFQDAPSADRIKPAALAFNGDTYQGLEAKTLSDDDMAYGQDYLRILSGLYGLLRPLDAIQPYRLEMGSRLKTRRGKSLYDYWGTTISRARNDLGDVQNTDTLVNFTEAPFKVRSKASRGLGAGTYMLTLGFNASTALVTLSQIPLFVYPVLAGSYSDMRAVGALGAANRILAAAGRERTVNRVGPDGKVETVT